MVRLGDVGKVITGNTPKTSEVQNYASNDICFVKPSDIAEGFVSYLNDSEFYISEHARAKARVLPPKSVLVTCIGIIGKVAINTVECAFNQQINAIIPNESKCVPEYLAYAIQNKQTEMRDIANAPVVPILNKTQFSNVEIKLPSLAEQAELVEKLNAVFELIIMRKAQLAKLDELVKSRFIELFGSVEDNRFGIKTVKIKDACELINGKAFKPEDWSDNGLPIVRIQNLNNEQAPFNYFEGEVKEQYLIDTGELLFSWSGTPGTSFGAFFWNRGKAVLNQHIFRVKPKLEFNLLFLQFALNGRIDFIISKAHGGVGLQHITKKELDEVELLLPSVEQQNQFAAFVEQTDKSKFEIQKSLEKLETLKKALMQKYFG